MPGHRYKIHFNGQVVATRKDESSAISLADRSKNDKDRIEIFYRGEITGAWNLIHKWINGKKVV